MIGEAAVSWYHKSIGVAQFRYHKQQLGLQGIRIADRLVSNLRSRSPAMRIGCQQLFLSGCEKQIQEQHP